MAQCAASFGYLLSSIFEKEESAVSLAPLFMMPIILFGGQFANSANIQVWIRWFQYLSPIRYGLEAFVRNEFDHRTYNPEIILKSLTTNLTVIIPNAFAGNGTASFSTTDWEIMQYPQINPVVLAGFSVGMWRCLVILAGLTVGLRVMSFTCLKYRVAKFQ